jgi:hypothetical protein
MSSTDNNLDSSLGIKPMLVAAPPQGSNGSIQQNNNALTNQNTQRQMSARFGGSRKVLKGGLVVPPVKVSYNDTGVGNTNTSANITNSTKVQADLYAAKEYDSQVGPVQKAGRSSKSRKLTGGWPAWGCMSGGKTHSKCRCKSCRKSRRKLKSRKLKSRRKLRKSSYRRRKSK